MPDVYRIHAETLEQMAQAIRQGTNTTEELSTDEMITLLRTMSNVGMRYPAGASDSTNEIFNDYANNSVEPRITYATARGKDTHATSSGQFVSGWGTGEDCASALLLTNNYESATTTHPVDKTNIFAVDWEGRIASGRASNGVHRDWKYNFEIANASNTLFAITSSGVPVLRGCYGTETPSKAITNPEEGMLYFQLIEKATEESESTDV